MWVVSKASGRVPFSSDTDTSAGPAVCENGRAGVSYSATAFRRGKSVPRVALPNVLLCESVEMYSVIDFPGFTVTSC